MRPKSKGQCIHSTLHYVACSGDTNKAGMQEHFHDVISLGGTKAAMQDIQCDL